MKLRIVASALLILALSTVISTNADAQRWRGYRGGYYRPHYGVRVWAPAPVIVPPVVVGGYYGPRYGPGYYGPRYYHRPYYGGYRHYGHRYYH